jgi:hypothetical protein
MSALGFLPVITLAVRFCQEADNFLTLESAVTPRGNAVCPYSAIITPAPQRVGMNVEYQGHFPDRKHLTQMFTICHIFSPLLYN